MKEHQPSIDRRSLIVGGASLLGGWALLGRHARAQSSSTSSSSDGRLPQRTLLLVELQGGNDGLSTVVPYADDAYHRARPRTRIERSAVLALDDYRGLHPELKGLRREFDDGRMAIIEGVGYPDPNLAHFTSQDIWHTARAGGRATGDGWIGRLMDNLHVAGESGPHAVHVGAAMPYSIKCSTRPLARNTATSSGTSITADAQRSVATYRTRVEYPDCALGEDLRTAAALLQGNTGCRVVSVSHQGYDTHDDQRRRHDTLMRELDRGLSAFLADMRGTPAGDEVVVLVYSEFGRSLADNATHGTDHGAAGPVFLLGTPVRGGIYGQHPELGQVDIAHTTDFRSIYTSVLERRFGIDGEGILGARYEPIAGCLA